MKVGVIGAGPAGLTVAYCLAREGVVVDVFEGSPEIGGLARSVKLWDQTVDIGPHRFFSSDRLVNELWLEVVGQDYAMVNRLTRIYYRGNFYNYPLRLSNTLSNLGMIESLACLGSYISSQVAKSGKDDSFETWVVRRFGRRLFEIFFKAYSEKLWGIPCTRLDSDFASQRIKKFSLYEAVVDAFVGSEKGKHKTLVDEFAYPTKGTGMVYQRMARFVNENGGMVYLNHPVKGVQVDNHSAKDIILQNGAKESYDCIVSSMPLTLLVKSITNTPDSVREAADRLKFRNSIIVYLKIDATDLFPDQWLYIHAPELRTGRVTNFRNWLPQLFGDTKHTILAMEYWCDQHDDLWNREDRSLVELASEEIKSTGLIGSAQITDGLIYRIPRCYPVYETGYKDQVDIIKSYLKAIDKLEVIGRYGSFKYNNQDHSILMGILVAENIVSGAEHDLWQINTDYDTYQESYVIDATGLAKI